MSSDRTTHRLLALVLAGTLAGASGPSALRAAAADADALAASFSGARAMHWIEVQCDLGPRPPGSPALEKLRRLIADHADSLGLASQRLCFKATDPWFGHPQEFCNLVVSIGPQGGDRLWFGAHYDTRPVSDLDPDPAKRDLPLLGANDGGSGTAILLHLMEILAANPPPRGVDLIFFDGEDSGQAGDPSGFCVGSRHLAATWRSFGSPLAAGRPRGLIVLDMVGRRGLRIAKEGHSRRFAPELNTAVFARAAELGLRAFVPEPGVTIYDDHVPFLEKGVPAIVLIDFDFPEWHTQADTPAICDPGSLAQVGRLAVSLALSPAGGF